jgi:hypothetical protein
MIPLGLLAKLLHGKAEYDQDSGTVTAEDGVVSINDNTIGTAAEQFNYTGTWSYGVQEGAAGNDNHWSTTTGSSFQVRFNGTKIKLYGAKAPGHGIAYISIDGSAAVAMDYYSDTRKDNTLIFESPTLGTDKEHVLTVVVSGLKNASSSSVTITADRVEITRSSTENLNLEQHPSVKFANELMAKQQEEQQFQQETQEFFQEFPDVNPDQIPQEAWTLREEKGLSLLDAYLRTTYKSLGQQKEQEAIQKLKGNALTSPGSLGGGDVQHNTNVNSLSTKDFSSLVDQVLRGERRQLYRNN